MKDLTGKSTARPAVIKDEDGKILPESEEIKFWWKLYCEELYASQETDGVPDDANEVFASYSKLSKELKNSIKIKVGQAVLELLIQNQHFDCFDL